MRRTDTDGGDSDSALRDMRAAGGDPWLAGLRFEDKAFPVTPACSHQGKRMGGVLAVCVVVRHSKRPKWTALTEEELWFAYPVPHCSGASWGVRFSGVI
jgi:hypothetical protein